MVACKTSTHVHSQHKRRFAMACVNKLLFLGRVARSTSRAFACRWLEAGGSLAALQELLGHASITTTQRYARLADVHVHAEAARLGNVRGRMWGKLGA